MISHIDIDKNSFTLEDARVAAKSIYSEQSKDFLRIKNEKWYHHLLNAVTLYSGDRKQILRDIRSLTALQNLFMQIYVEHYRGLDEQLNKIIDDLGKVNQVAKNLYMNCVLKIHPQAELPSLNAVDQNLLILFLGEYHSLNGHEEDFRHYRTAIAKCIHGARPEGEFAPEQLSKVSAVEVFYRCAVELCAVDECFDTSDTMELPDKIWNALRYLNISQMRKDEIENSVRKEQNLFDRSYWWEKYDAETNCPDSFYEGLELGDPNASGTSEKPALQAMAERPEKEYAKISHECAQIYFKDQEFFNENLCSIEAADYVVYSEKEALCAIHKQTGISLTLTKTLSEPWKAIQEGRVAAYSNSVYCVIDNDLCLFDLDTGESRKLYHMEETYRDDGRLIEPRIIAVHKARYLVYKTDCVYVADLGQNPATISKIKLGCTGHGYVYGDYLYFLDKLKKGKVSSYHSYQLKRYSFLNGIVTDVSVPFVNKKKSIYPLHAIIRDGIYNNYYYAIFCYVSTNILDIRTVREFYRFELSASDQLKKPDAFYIWKSKICQMEQYRQYLIYVNADNNYSLVKHDFITDKKQVLVKGLGKDKKAGLGDIFMLGKTFSQKPEKYMRMGNWIWALESDKFTPQLINISGN